MIIRSIHDLPFSSFPEYALTGRLIGRGRCLSLVSIKPISTTTTTVSEPKQSDY